MTRGEFETNPHWMKFALCVQTDEVPLVLPLALLSGPFEEKLRKARRFGFTAVEILTTNPAKLDADRIKAAIRDNGLSAAAVGSGGLARSEGLTLLQADPAKTRQTRKRFLKMVRFTASVEAPVVTIGSVRGSLAGSAPHGREAIVEFLREAANLAASLSVRLALEPINRYETDLIHNVAEGLEFIAEVDHPSLGLLVDTFHVNIEESSWTAPFREALAVGKLFHVHVADNNRLSPGRGLIDFRVILNTLEEGGYTGAVCAEHLPLPDADHAAEMTGKHLRKLGSFEEE